MVKKIRFWIVGCAVVVGVCAFGIVYCNMGKKDADIKENQEIASNVQETEKEGLLYNYEENSDGTWSANGITYQHKVVLTGKMANAINTTTYVVLTNNSKLTFEDVEKSFISSNSADQLDAENACVVQMY